MNHKFFAITAFSTLSLFLAGCSLAADVTPPPNYQTPTAPLLTETPPATAMAATPLPAEAAMGTAPAGASGAAQPVPGGTSVAGATTVSGQISNGSGGSVPAGLAVTLHGYDSMQETYTKSTEADSSGRYSFLDVQVPSGRVFVVSVSYQGMTFNSDIGQPQDAATPINLPLTIYELTKDASSVVIDRIHIFFDFSTPGMAQIVELALVSNSGKAAVEPATPGKPVVEFAIPQGAQNVQFQGGTLGQRFVETNTGVGDTQIIPPGTDTSQVLFAYELPYKGKLDLTLPSATRVNAIVVMLPKSNVQLKSAQLMPSTDQNVQGTTYHVYSGNGIPANSQLSFSLSGQPSGATIGGINLPVTPTLLAGLVLFLLTLAVAGLWLYRVRAIGRAPARPVQAEPENQDALIDAIAALDDLYQAGKLPEHAYRERRAALKARLAAIYKGET